MSLHVARSSRALEIDKYWCAIDDFDPYVFQLGPGRYVTDMAFNPSNAMVLYLTLSGFDESTPTAPGHVFMLIINGPNFDWSNVSPWGGYFFR